MKILINDLATVDNSTIASENSGFPLANLYSDGLVEKTLITSTIDVDLASALLIDTIGTVDQNLTLRISAGGVVGSQTFSFDTDPTLVTEINFISQTYQYWRVEILGALVDESPIEYEDNEIFIKATGAFAQAANFFPMTSDINTIISSGSGAGSLGNAYQVSGVGEGVTLSFYNPDQTPKLNIVDDQGGLWDTFSTEANGLKRIVFPSLANNDGLGGFAELYYHQIAYTHAFNGNASACIPASNGSVYKDTLIDANLVVRWDGMTGPAGSATPDVLTDTPRPMNLGAITPGLMNYLYIGNSLQIPAINGYSTPDLNDTDAVARTSGHQIITTPGTFFQTQEFPVSGSTQAQYVAFLDWYKSSDRAKNHLIVPFENSMDCSPFEPYYAKIFANFNSRVNLAFDYTITTEESK
jgi:hypothetical protein